MSGFVDVVPLVAGVHLVESEVFVRFDELLADPAGLPVDGGVVVVPVADGYFVDVAVDAPVDCVDGGCGWALGVWGAAGDHHVPMFIMVTWIEVQSSMNSSQLGHECLYRCWTVSHLTACSAHRGISVMCMLRQP